MMMSFICSMKYQLKKTLKKTHDRCMLFPVGSSNCNDGLADANRRCARGSANFWTRRSFRCQSMVAPPCQANSRKLFQHKHSTTASMK